MTLFSATSTCFECSISAEHLAYSELNNIIFRCFLKDFRLLEHFVKYLYNKS